MPSICAVLSAQKRYTPGLKQSADGCRSGFVRVMFSESLIYRAAHL